MSTPFNHPCGLFSSKNETILDKRWQAYRGDKVPSIAWQWATLNCLHQPKRKVVHENKTESMRTKEGNMRSVMLPTHHLEIQRVADAQQVNGYYQMGTTK